jgi:hypothetical protein
MAQGRLTSERLTGKKLFFQGINYSSERGRLRANGDLSPEKIGFKKVMSTRIAVPLTNKLIDGRKESLLQKLWTEMIQNHWFFQQMESTQRAIEPLQDGILRLAKVSATMEGNLLKEADETLVKIMTWFWIVRFKSDVCSWISNWGQLRHRREFRQQVKLVTLGSLIRLCKVSELGNGWILCSKRFSVILVNFGLKITITYSVQ